jgi:hypothetical protein
VPNIDYVAPKRRPFFARRKLTPDVATGCEEAGSNDFARIGRVHWLHLLLRRAVLGRRFLAASG